MAFSRSADQPAALAEGRRIYLGNLLYIAQPAEIEEMLRDNGFPEYEKIHISMDPVSGRNPGYCFVDFLGRDDADRALSSLDASIRGRPLKVGPCEPKKQQQRTATAAFQRWGNWSGQRDRRAGDDSEDKGGVDQGPSAAIEHFNEVVATDTDGRRLYVGGLAKMVDQQHNQDEMREILGDFNPVAIGKRITPHESKRTAPGNHHYCFVDFATVEEAAAARDALDGKSWAGERLRVNVARPLPDKLRDRAHPKDPASPARDNTVRGERPTRSNWSPGGERSSWRKPGGNGSNGGGGGGGDSADGSSGNSNGNGNSNSSKPSQPLRSLASGNWRQRE